jgi:hypothetical protein
MSAVTPASYLTVARACAAGIHRRPRIAGGAAACAAPAITLATAAALTVVALADAGQSSELARRRTRQSACGVGYLAGLVTSPLRRCSVVEVASMAVPPTSLVLV